MCGICGFEAATVDAGVLHGMNACLRPRGPDDEGYFLGDGVALGIRRLRVIDPLGGGQPVTNEDASVHLVYNGEIYNYRELRTELRRRGHAFASESDTEVLVHGYEEWGGSVVELLNGMFAFAIWDARSRSWFLARDPLGQKPLYYHHSPGLFVFASEPKAILAHPGVPRRLDAASLAAYLAFEYVPSPDSIYDGIRKLPPAHRMHVRAGCLTIEPYWEFPVRSAPGRGEGKINDRRWAIELRDRLGQAVRRCLVADVPVGCFLSGGLDSSAVAVLMKERLGDQSLRTFSIGFTDPSFDESGHAARVAGHVNSDHHVEVLEPEQLFDLIPRAAGFMDEPLGDGSVLPTLALAAFARRYVTVALSGDGGDELLGGYPTLFAEPWAERYCRLPEPLHRLALAAAGRIPVSTADMSFDFKVKQFLRSARMPSDIRHFGWVGSFHPTELPLLLHADIQETALAASPYARVAQELQRSPRPMGLDRLLLLYARFYLGDDVLVKVDRCTMACGLETRAPFLDPDFVRFAATIPPRLKVHGTRTKILLRRAFSDALPSSILKRPKKGFGMPVARWMRGPLRGLLQDMLSEDRIRGQGLFEPEPLGRLCREHLEGRADHRKALWTMLAFQLWHERHMEA